MKATITENDTAHIASSILKLNIPTMAYTARSWNAINFILETLLKVGISFAATLVSSASTVQQPTETTGFGFKDGVLTLILRNQMDLTETKDKGGFLIAFLTAIGFPYKKILFIDNCYKTVVNVVRACSQQMIPATGIWYRKSEEKVRAFTDREKEELVTFSRENNWWQIEHDHDDIRRHLLKHTQQG